MASGYVWMAGDFGSPEMGKYCGKLCLRACRMTLLPREVAYQRLCQTTAFDYSGRNAVGCQRCFSTIDWICRLSILTRLLEEPREDENDVCARR